MFLIQKDRKDNKISWSCHLVLFKNINKRLNPFNKTVLVRSPQPVSEADYRLQDATKSKHMHTAHTTNTRFLKPVHCNRTENHLHTAMQPATRIYQTIFSCYYIILDLENKIFLPMWVLLLQNTIFSWDLPRVSLNDVKKQRCRYRTRFTQGCILIQFT